MTGPASSAAEGRSLKRSAAALVALVAVGAAATWWLNRDPRDDHARQACASVLLIGLSSGAEGSDTLAQQAIREATLSSKDDLNRAAALQPASSAVTAIAAWCRENR